MTSLKRKEGHKLNIFGCDEYPVHLCCKLFLIQQMLKKGKKMVATEVMIDGRIVDVVDDELRILYEVERHPTIEYIRKFQDFAKAHGAVACVINLEKLPKNVGVMELHKIMGEYVEDG